MNTTLFEIASRVGTPLALSGIIIVVLFAIYQIILRKEIFPKLTKIHSFKIINKIINYLFILALVATILGVTAYVIIQIIPESRKNIETAEVIGPSVKSIPSETLIIEIPPPKFPSTEKKQTYSSTSTNKDFSIIHYYIEEKTPFPIIKFTLMNGTEKTQVITKLKVIIHEFGTGLASPNPLVLKPIVAWDIKLPYDEGTFNFKPSNPILIPSDDAASIILRLFIQDIGGPTSPHNALHFVLKFVFICGSGFEANSPFFILWNGDVITE